MRIGILSDTHDQVTRTRTAVSLLMAEGAEVLIHCGDLTTPEVVHECCHLTTYFVFGNCDHRRGELVKAISAIQGICLDHGGLVTLDGRRIAVTHGDLDREVKRLLAAEPDYLLSGHTHEPHDEQKGKTRFINPGALHRATTWTVALLDTATNHLRMLPLINTTMHH